VIEVFNPRSMRRRAVQSEWRGDAKALARAACAAGRRGLFDIVRCEYAAPAFVIASGDAAG